MDAITSSTDTFDSASFPSLTHVTSTTRGPKAEPTEDDFYAEVRYKTYKKLGERGRRAAKTAMDTGVIDEVRIEAGGGGGGGKQATEAHAMYASDPLSPLFFFLYPTSTQHRTFGGRGCLRLK